MLASRPNEKGPESLPAPRLPCPAAVLETAAFLCPFRFLLPALRLIEPRQEGLLRVEQAHVEGHMRRIQLDAHIPAAELGGAVAHPGPQPLGPHQLVLGAQGIDDLLETMLGHLDEDRHQPLVLGEDEGGLLHPAHTHVAARVEHRPVAVAVHTGLSHPLEGIPHILGRRLTHGQPQHGHGLRLRLGAAREEQQEQDRYNSNHFDHDGVLPDEFHFSLCVNGVHTTGPARLYPASQACG